MVTWEWVTIKVPKGAKEKKKQEEEEKKQEEEQKKQEEEEKEKEQVQTSSPKSFLSTHPASMAKYFRSK